MRSPTRTGGAMERRWLEGLGAAALAALLATCAPGHEAEPDWCGAVASERDGIVTRRGCAGCDPRCWVTEDAPSSAADVVLSGASQNGDGIAYSAGAGGIVISGLASGLDSDGDGLPDVVDPNPFDPNGDADGDGWPDAWEAYLGTSPTVADPPPPADEWYVVLPYEGGPVTRTLPGSIPVMVRSADVYFLIDTTYSMAGEVSNLKASLSSYVVPEVEARIADVQFGVGHFRDYADQFGGPHIPYEHIIDVTGDIPAVQAALDSLAVRGTTADLAESQTAALHAVATGADIGCGVGPASCAPGLIGYPCFRSDAVPIIVLVTDHEFHNGVWDDLDPPAPGDCYEYASGGCDHLSPCIPPSPPCPPLQDVVGELRAIGAKVVGIWSGWPNNLGPFHTWTWGRTYPDYDDVIDLWYTVTETGSVDGLGRPFLYGVAADGTGIGAEVVNGIDDLVATMLIDVSSSWRDPDPAAPDTSVLIDDVDPVACDSCSSLSAATNTAYGVTPGTGVTFSVTLRNDTGEIPAELTARSYDVLIEIWGDGTTLLASRLVHVLVPGTLVTVPTTTGHYWRTYDALATCAPGQTPLWSRLHPVTTEPTGTSIRYTVRTSATDPSVTTDPGATGSYFYGLPYDYFQWDPDAGALLRRAVTYGFPHTPVVGAVGECVDQTYNTDGSTTPGGPYAGEYNATLGALAHAGFPSSHVVPFATPAAAAAAAGTYEVLLFMEQESCNPPTAPWLPIVTDLVGRGGRVVMTYPGAGGASFINNLGTFGTGLAASPTTPYTPAPHPFWTGITHPGYLNATQAWSWSGPDLVPLAYDSGGRLTVWGWGQRADGTIVELPLPTPVPDRTGDVLETLEGAGLSPNLRFLRIDAYMETSVPGVSPVIHELVLEHYCL